MRVKIRFFSTPIYLTIIILCTLVIQAKTSQSTETWSITLYDSDIASLVEITETEINYIRIPQSDREIVPTNPDEVEFARRYLSDDGRYLLTIFRWSHAYMTEAVIKNMITGENYKVGLPPLEETEFFVSYHFGAFSPDMTAVALPYISHVPISGCCGNGGIVVVDLTTGTITHRLDIDERFQTTTAWVDDWTNDGIWFAPRCSGCSPQMHYFYKVWHPYENAIVDTTVFHYRHMLERLESSGEILYSENHADFPLGGSTYPVLQNVITLYQEDEILPQTAGQVVYYNDEHPENNPNPHWIMNGAAFLVNENNLHNAVVFRNGDIIHSYYDSMQTFLLMTNTGWLTINQENNVITQFVVSDQTIREYVIYETGGDIQIVNEQSNLSGSELTEFDIDISPPDGRFCPGTLPTRLQAGDWAKIIAEHRVVAIAQFAEGDVSFENVKWREAEALRVGAEVQILDDFACVETGWGYLKVEYQGRVGWILEIYGGAYHIAPTSR